MSEQATSFFFKVLEKHPSGRGKRLRFWTEDLSVQVEQVFDDAYKMRVQVGEFPDGNIVFHSPDNPDRVYSVPVRAGRFDGLLVRRFRGFVEAEIPFKAGQRHGTAMLVQDGKKVFVKYVSDGRPGYSPPAGTSKPVPPPASKPSSTSRYLPPSPRTPPPTPRYKPSSSSKGYSGPAPSPRTDGLPPVDPTRVRGITPRKDDGGPNLPTDAFGFLSSDAEPRDCTRCNRQIEQARLEILPDTNVCARCAAEVDKNAARRQTARDAQSCPRCGGRLVARKGSKGPYRKCATCSKSVF